MNELLKETAGAVFAYPIVPERRHGSAGYTNYQSFKPWLRHVFLFRCVYCGCRERWEPNGHRSSRVEHIQPRAARPDLIGEYDNLLHPCVTCDSARQDVPLPLDPTRPPLHQHLRVGSDGFMEPLTDEGLQLIDICQLSRVTLVGFHRRV
jgi:hypothetical protein